MITEACIIVFSAFATYGFFCSVLMLFSAVKDFSAPPSVTFMVYSNDEETQCKKHLLHNTIPNNRVVLVSSDNSCVPDGVCRICEISSVASQRLFTKKAD